MIIPRSIESTLTCASLACYGIAAYAGRKVPLAAGCKVFAAAASLLGKDDVAKTWDKTADDYWIEVKKNGVRDLTAVIGFIVAGLATEYAAEALQEKPQLQLKPTENPTLPKPKEEEPLTTSNEETPLVEEEEETVLTEEESGVILDVANTVLTRKNLLMYGVFTKLFYLHKKGLLTKNGFSLLTAIINNELQLFESGVQEKAANGFFFSMLAEPFVTNSFYAARMGMHLIDTSITLVPIYLKVWARHTFLRHNFLQHNDMLA